MDIDIAADFEVDVHTDFEVHADFDAHLNVGVDLASSSAYLSEAACLVYCH